MPHPLNLHDFPLGKNLVNYPVIANANAMGLVRARKLFRSVRERLLCELFDSGEDPRDFLPRELA